MKLTTGILIMGMAAATAWAQNPDAIQNTRDTMKAVQLKKQLDSNAALAASQGGTPQAASAQPSKRPSGAAPSSANGPFVRKKAAASTPPEAKKQPAAKSKTTVVAVRKPRQSKPQVAVENGAVAAETTKKAKPVNLAGRRDPFVNPVVNQAMVGSGCSTGKRCLAIDQIALKGVVRSEAGMIAVVVNALDKAYFLHENDPVFNGYVVKITGDSIVFKETVQDKIGHPFTREVTKKITTPAV
jgi:Tfp pilus assembly protein PilP